MGKGKEGTGGGGEGGVLRTLSRTLKSRNNASRWLKLRLRFTEFSDVKGQCMAGPVYNATVCSVTDELPVIVFCLKPLRKDIPSSLPLFCVY